MSDVTSSQDTQRFDSALVGTMVVVVIGSFMSLLDSTIVNIAIESLTRAFDAPLATIQWVSTGYLLALAAVIPLTGWASARFGTKRLYLVSIAVFALASLLAGLAWSAGSLIVFRVLQGIGGGMLMPAGMAMVSRQAGPDRVGRAMGVVGVPMLLGPVLGPILGGYLIDIASWRWVFLINLPIGIIGMFLGARLLTHDQAAVPPRIDWLGLILLSPGLVSVIFGLSKIDTAGLANPWMTIPLAGGLMLAAGFVRHSTRASQPLLDLKLLRGRSMAAAATTTALQALAFNSTLFLLPLYFQVAQHQSAATTGLLIAPLGVGAAAVQTIAGRLTDRMPAGRVVLGGMIPFALGLLIMTTVAKGTPLWLTLIATLFIGLGAGFTQMPIMTAGLRTVAPAAAAHASTLLNILTRAGAAVGVAFVALTLGQHLTTGGDTGRPEAFATTFWWPTAFLALAIAASLFLPLRRLAQTNPPLEPDSRNPSATE